MTGSRDDDGGGTTISFQGVYAQQINTAGRDMVVSAAPAGGWHVAQEQLSLFRGQLDGLDLPGPARRTVDHALDRAEHESRGAQPDRTAFARHIESAADVLRSSGALFTAGAEALAPLHALAAWLGPLGATAARMLTL
jgi:hypothetical protein